MNRGEVGTDRARGPGNAAPSASPLSSKVESASRVGRFPDFRVVACARLPPAARGKSDMECASAHRIQWRDRGLGPALRDIAAFGAPPARNRARRAHAPGCHFPFTRLRGHPPAFRYSGVTSYILAQPPILAKTGRRSPRGPVRIARRGRSGLPEASHVWSARRQPYICTARCQYATNYASSWSLGICRYYRRVFPDVSRIRTIGDAYRDVYPHKGVR